MPPPTPLPHTGLFTLNLPFPLPCLCPAPQSSPSAAGREGVALCGVLGYRASSKSCQRQSGGGVPLPARGRWEWGLRLRFTLNPRKSPRLEKCSIRHRSLSADRLRSSRLGTRAGGPPTGPQAEPGLRLTPPTQAPAPCPQGLGTAPPRSPEDFKILPNCFG